MDRTEELEQRIKEFEKENSRLKKIESDLENSQEKLRILFDEAPDAYFISDIKGNFIDGNKAAEKLIGYKKEELIGKNMAKLNLVPLNQIPLILRRLADHALGKTTKPGEIILMKKGGSKVITEISGNMVKIGGENMVLGIVRDITERKKMEKEIYEKSKEMERFNKIAIGRELQMVELKNKIKELEDKTARSK